MQPVLLIDDDPGAYRYLAQVVGRLPERPYRVLWSPSAHDALGHLDHAAEYAAILIDFDLGGDCNGLDLLRDLRRQDPPCPLIVVTAGTSADVESRCMQAGADDYLLKDELAPMVVHRAIVHARERRAFQRSLREQELRYRQLAQHFPQGAVLVLDHDGRCQIAEGCLLERLERPGRSLVGRQPGPLLADAMATFIADCHSDLLRDPNSPRCTEASRECLVDDHHYLLRATALPGADEPGLLVVISDVTDLRSAQEALVHSARLASVGTLASGVSHELGNLHSLMMGHLERIRRTPQLPVEVEPRLATLEQASERASEISRNLLGFARGCSQGFTRTNVDHLIADTIELVGFHLERQGIRVQADLAPTPHVWVQPAAISQVLINLIINAAQAMGLEGERRIDVSTRCEGERLLIEVRDTGRGMEPAVLRRAFEPFFTTKQSSEDDSFAVPQQGTGLGLTVCRTIIANHQGRITASSLPGRGTTFRISLPLEHPSRDPTPEPERDLSPASGVVLVVEDDAALRQLLVEILSEHGYRVLQAADGAAADRIMRQRRVDVVLADLLMPQRTGWQLIDEAARLPDPPAIVVISGLREDDLSPQQMGMVDEFLTKPVDIPVLCRTVDAIAARRRG